MLLKKVKFEAHLYIVLFLNFIYLNLLNMATKLYFKFF